MRFTTCASCGEGIFLNGDTWHLIQVPYNRSSIKCTGRSMISHVPTPEAAQKRLT